jgi:hypothetical protein
MTDPELDTLTLRIYRLEREVWRQKMFWVATMAVLGLVMLSAAATQTKVQEEVRAKRFVVVDANGKNLLDMWAAGDSLPTLTLYDQQGNPRTQLDILPDGSPRLYFADAERRIRMRFGAATEGRSHMEIIDGKGGTIWKAP